MYLAKLGVGEFPDGGNAGMLDLVLALQWVRDHAREFGGDPNRVMLFGQAGGGAKIATLMVMPAARNLFHRGQSTCCYAACRNFFADVETAAIGTEQVA